MLSKELASRGHDVTVFCASKTAHRPAAGPDTISEVPSTACASSRSTTARRARSSSPRGSRPTSTSRSSPRPSAPCSTGSGPTWCTCTPCRASARACSTRPSPAACAACSRRTTCGSCAPATTCCARTARCATALRPAPAPRASALPASRTAWRPVTPRCSTGSPAASTAALAVSESVKRILGDAGFDRTGIDVVRQGAPDTDLIWERLGRDRGPAGRHDPAHRDVRRRRPHKGLHLLVEAAQKLPEGVRVEVHHGGVPPAYLRRLLELDVDGRVELCGYYLVSELPELLAGIDVAVVPSAVWETAGLVVEEALAGRVPVVAARMGGLAEGVTDGVDGLLFDGLSADDLAAKLTRLATEPGLLETAAGEHREAALVRRVRRRPRAGLRRRAGRRRPARAARGDPLAGAAAGRRGRRGPRGRPATSPAVGGARRGALAAGPAVPGHAGGRRPVGLPGPTRGPGRRARRRTPGGARRRAARRARRRRHGRPGHAGLARRRTASASCWPPGARCPRTPARRSS